MSQFTHAEKDLYPLDPSLKTPRQPQPLNAQRISLKKLRGGFLLAIGYLLSPLCWWNDLVFNLPVAYFFGYLCSLFSSNLLLPGCIAGYWLSNVIGIVMMQMGVIDVARKDSQERNFKRDLWMGIATSTVYTLAIVALVQFQILDVSALIPDVSSLDLGAFLPLPGL